VNAEEALKICRLAKAASPAQAVDEYTPDIWAAVLEPHRFQDAYQAVIELAGSQEWIHVSHVKRRIKQIRAARISEFGLLPTPPDGMTDREWRTWHDDMIRRIGDGEDVPKPPALEPSPQHKKRWRELVGGAFEMPSEDA